MARLPRVGDWGRYQGRQWILTEITEDELAITDTDGAEEWVPPDSVEWLSHRVSVDPHKLVGRHLKDWAEGRLDEGDYEELVECEALRDLLAEQRQMAEKRCWRDEWLDDNEGIISDIGATRRQLIETARNATPETLQALAQARINRDGTDARVNYAPLLDASLKRIAKASPVGRGSQKEGKV